MNTLLINRLGKFILPLSILGILIPILGSFLIILAGVFLFKVHISNKSKKYNLILGKVAEINECISRSSDVNGYCHEVIYNVPTFEYIYNNKTYRVAHNILSKGIEKFEIGDNVELKVPIDFPDEAVLNSNFSVNLYLYAGITFVISGLFMMSLFISFKLITIFDFFLLA